MPPTNRLSARVEAAAAAAAASPAAASGTSAKSRSRRTPAFSSARAAALRLCLWQILLLGTIPVVESNPGFDRTYSRLPVLVVRNYTDLTPSLLRRAYPCFRENAHRFDFRALTLPYWLDLVDEAVRTGSIDHVTRQHPYRNAYCDFLK